MGHDRVTAIPFIGSCNLCTARNGHGMVMSRSPLGNHQIVLSPDFVKVRRLRPDCVPGCPLPEHTRLANETHGAQVQLLEPDFSMPFIAAAGCRPVANIPDATIVIKE